MIPRNDFSKITHNLQVQYRFTPELAAFPSREFYESRLKSHVQDSTEFLKPLSPSTFPWPYDAGKLIPTVFIQCDSEESMGGASKGNEGQVKVVREILALLRTSKNPELGPPPELEIAVLSPYSKQTKEFKHALKPPTPAFTIDSFQGRESDIIVFSTVRCNVSGEIGFVDDARRLNVVWTRAKLGLIIVGDRKTMVATSGLWKRAIEACTEVRLP